MAFIHILRVNFKTIQVKTISNINRAQKRLTYSAHHKTVLEAAKKMVNFNSFAVQK